jgi:sulfur carrier protein
MNIQLNGEPRTLPASATLHDLLQAEQLLQRRVAVEVNGEIVSRSRHGEHVLAEGDVVEIVHALGGGGCGRVRSLSGLHGQRHPALLRTARLA